MPRLVLWQWLYLPSALRHPRRNFPSPLPPPPPRKLGFLSCRARMTAPPAPHALRLNGGQSVAVVPAPGLSDSDFRNAIESTLLKQWIRNLEGENGILARGDVSLVQGVDMFGKRVGFLKFKADVIDKETGKKISCIASPKHR